MAKSKETLRLRLTPKNVRDAFEDECQLETKGVRIKVQLPDINTDNLGQFIKLRDELDKEIKELRKDLEDEEADLDDELDDFDDDDYDEEDIDEDDDFVDDLVDEKKAKAE